MKSKTVIITVVLLLVPILVGATPLKIALKMGAGCPFKPGPKLDRCNPSIIQTNTNPSHSLIVPILFGSLSSPLLSLANGPFNEFILACSPTTSTVFPLRC